MGYTYEQLKQMGATPAGQKNQVPVSNVPQTPSPQTASTSSVPKKKYSFNELQQMGAKPVSTPQPEKTGFWKSLIQTPLTIAARPVQAALGAASFAIGGQEGYNTAVDKMDKFSKEKLGGLVAPTPQNASDVLKDVGRGVELASYGVGGPAAKAAFTPAKPLFKKAVETGVKEAGAGALFGAGSALREKGTDVTAGDIAKSSAIGAGTGFVGGAALSAAAPAVTKLLSPAERAAKRLNESKEAMKRIVLSRKGDITKDSEKAYRALRELDIDGVETNADLVSRIDEQIGNIAKNMDEVLETDITKRPLSQLQYTTKVGNETVRHNFVDEAISQLEKEYLKTNNIRGVSEMSQLRKRAMEEGLTVKEVNDIARRHSRDLNAFSPFSGELSSGLAKQTAENTRKGLKETARKNFGNKISEEADRAISDLSRLKQIAANRVKAVENIKTTLVKPSLLQKAGGLIEQVVNIATLGSSRAIANVALRGGSKAPTRLNALALEQMLAKDLKLIQDMMKKGASDETIISKLQNFVKSNGEKPVLLLEAPKTRNTLFSPPKGPATPNLQEAVDVASVQTGKAKTPKAGVGRNRQIKIKEAMEGNIPFVDPKTLPSIQMGSKPKIGDTYKGKPVIELGSSNPKVQSPKAPEKYIPEDQLPVIEFGKSKKTNRQKGSALTNLIAGTGLATGTIAAGAKIADVFNKGRNTAQKTGSDEKVPATPVPKKDLRRGFLHVENRGAAAQGKDVYKVKGVTGDLGKYQVKPETLKDWSKPWLDKQYTPEEFLNDPQAQEEFMNQFLAVVDAYELSPEDAAVIWHKGWGVLGDSRPREEKKKALRKHIEEKKPEAQKYIQTFNEGLNS